MSILLETEKRTKKTYNEELESFMAFVRNAEFVLLHNLKANKTTSSRHRALAAAAGVMIELPTFTTGPNEYSDMVSFSRFS